MKDILLTIGILIVVMLIFFVTAMILDFLGVLVNNIFALTGIV